MVEEQLGTIPTNLRLIEADATSLPLEKNSFDFAFSYASLYGVPNVEKAISEIGRVLKPGGYAVIELGNLLILFILSWL